MYKVCHEKLHKVDNEEKSNLSQSWHDSFLQFNLRTVKWKNYWADSYTVTVLGKHICHKWDESVKNKDNGFEQLNQGIAKNGTPRDIIIVVKYLENIMIVSLENSENKG